MIRKENVLRAPGADVSGVSAFVHRRALLLAFIRVR